MPAPLPKCSPEQCCSKNIYQIKPVGSWEGLRNLYIENEDTIGNGRWIFRGLPKSDFCLVTSLERALRDRFGCDMHYAHRHEKRLLRQFMRTAPILASQTPGEENVMEWLALLRHHGGPTRLMDWTYSFWIAVFFAVERAKNDESCAVWALDVDWWTERTKEHIPHLAHLLINETSNSQAELDFILNVKGEAGVWPVNPFRFNERLHAQQGLFLMPLDISKPFMENLGIFDVPGEVVRQHFWKIVIKCDTTLLAACLTELHRMNVNSQALFRGLGGLARDLENQILMPHLFKGVNKI